MKKSKHIKKPKNPPKLFIEHVAELRKRLLWCLSFFILISTLLYFVYPTLLTWLLHPLQQTVYYTSPVGGLTLIMQVCLLFGFLLSLPIFVYHSYRFVQPALPKHSKKQLLLLIVSSIVLMLMGTSFAYFISLPIALHFLSGFGTEQVKSLITTSEYFSFISRYLLGFGILFQLPLILLSINSITPLSTKMLLGQSRYVIIVTVIIAAILTPTPDPINQLLMAVPIIVLYYCSCLLIWYYNKYHLAK